MKNNVYFIDSKNQERVIGIANTEQEVFTLINAFLEEHNYKSYYTRVWFNSESGRMRYDVGSHTEFFESDFIIKGEDN